MPLPDYRCLAKARSENQVGDGMKQSDTGKLSILLHPAGKVGQILFPAIFHPVRIKVVFHIHIIQSAIEVISTVNFLFMNRSFLYVQYQGKDSKSGQISSRQPSASRIKNCLSPFANKTLDTSSFIPVHVHPEKSRFRENSRR